MFQCRRFDLTSGSNGRKLTHFMNHERDADNNGRTTTALFELAVVTPVSPPIMAEPDGVVRENAESFRQIIRGRELGFLSLNKQEVTRGAWQIGVL